MPILKLNSINLSILPSALPIWGVSTLLNKAHKFNRIEFSGGTGLEKWSIKVDCCVPCMVHSKHEILH